jgi:hypothetical protein
VASLFAAAEKAPDSPSCIAVGLVSPRAALKAAAVEEEASGNTSLSEDEAVASRSPSTMTSSPRDTSSLSDRSRSTSRDSEGNTTASANSTLDGKDAANAAPAALTGRLHAPPEPARPAPQSFGELFAHADEVTAALRWQMEFYFSAQNLCRDMYLRSQMDPLGFVSLATCARFNKMQQLLVAAGPHGPALLLVALQTSATLQVAMPWAVRASPGPHPDAAIFNCRVRTAVEPERWPVVSQPQAQPMVPLHHPRAAFAGQ